MFLYRICIFNSVIFHFKGFRLPYDTPTMRVVTHLATGLYTMTSHDSPKEDNFLKFGCHNIKLINIFAKKEYRIYGEKARR